MAFGVVRPNGLNAIRDVDGLRLLELRVPTFACRAHDALSGRAGGRKVYPGPCSDSGLTGLAIEPVTGRPRARAGWLDHKVEPVLAAVWHLPAGFAGFQLFDCGGGQGLGHFGALRGNGVTKMPVYEVFHPKCAQLYDSARNPLKMGV